MCHANEKSFIVRLRSRFAGLLGTFPKGAMVPPFDKAVFNPDTPVGTAVGPVQTHFGYHLIFIHDRKLPPVKEKKVVRI